LATLKVVLTCASSIKVEFRMRVRQRGRRSMALSVRV
jgi:hypothetical protein